MTNLRYLVEIDGDADALKRLSGLFCGLSFIITAAPDGRVFLSGASFETCATPEEVTETASHVLRWLASILEVYAGASDKFTVKNVFWIDDRGHLMQRIILTMEFRMLGDFTVLAASSTSNATLGSDLLRLASMDDQVARAFDLIGGKVIGWYEIYDLIDVMGKVRGLVNRGWAARGPLSSIRQTANHYRHLGSAAKKYKLPNNPSRFHDARATIINIFRRWLDERLSKALGPDHTLPRDGEVLSKLD
ncbi:MAG: hypothetical protein ACREX4_13505 [Gammaproteobacteria bacterium]